MLNLSILTDGNAKRSSKQRERGRGLLGRNTLVCIGYLSRRRASYIGE
jgi:hypothetical protein